MRQTDPPETCKLGRAVRRRVSRAAWIPTRRNREACAATDCV